MELDINKCIPRHEKITCVAGSSSYYSRGVGGGGGGVFVVYYQNIFFITPSHGQPNDVFEFHVLGLVLPRPWSARIPSLCLKTSDTDSFRSIFWVWYCRGCSPRVFRVCVFQFNFLGLGLPQS